MWRRSIVPMMQHDWEEWVCGIARLSGQGKGALELGRNVDLIGEDIPNQPLSIQVLLVINPLHSENLGLILLSVSLYSCPVMAT